MISINALLCCQLAEEEERLDDEIREQLGVVLDEQKRMRAMIDKRDALKLVRRHLLEGRTL